MVTNQVSREGRKQGSEVGLWFCKAQAMALSLPSFHWPGSSWKALLGYWRDGGHEISPAVSWREAMAASRLERGRNRLVAEPRGIRHQPEPQGPASSTRTTEAVPPGGGSRAGERAPSPCFPCSLIHWHSPGAHLTHR